MKSIAPKKDARKSFFGAARGVGQFTEEDELNTHN